jgi:hypothetical protein
LPNAIYLAEEARARQALALQDKEAPVDHSATAGSQTKDGLLQLVKKIGFVMRENSAIADTADTGFIPCSEEYLFVLDERSSTSTPVRQRPPNDASPPPAQSMIETLAAANPTPAAYIPPVPSPPPEPAVISGPRAPRDATAIVTKELDEYSGHRIQARVDNGIV